MSGDQSPLPGPVAGEPGGFQFPGDFEITAMGAAEAALEARILVLLEEQGLRVLHETVQRRNSREGRFVSVTVSFHCETREDYQKAHEVLRSDPDIHYTL